MMLDVVGVISGLRKEEAMLTASLNAMAVGASHPTLPLMWTAQVPATCDAYFLPFVWRAHSLLHTRSIAMLA